MADNVNITPGVGQAIAADEVTDGTLGTASVQFVKLMDGTIGGTNKASVNSAGEQAVSITSPVTIAGNASATPVPVSGNVGLTGNLSGNVSISGNVGLAAGTNTIGALTGNQTVVVTSGNIAITSQLGNLSVIGPTAVGAAAATAPVLIAGTANATATGLVQVIKVDSAGNQFVTGNVAVTSVSGNQTVIGPTADGSAAATAPVLMAGTVDGSGTGAISIPQIAATGEVLINIGKIGNTTILTGGVNGSQGVGGLAANNATASGNPVQASAIAISAEATAATVGQNAALVVGLEHKLINLPYANKENMVRGTASIGNTAATTIIAAQGANIKTYITGLQLGNTGGTTVTVTMSDSASSVFIVPTGGGSNLQFPVPLVTAGNTAFTMTASGNTTTLYGSAQGYTGS